MIFNLIEILVCLGILALVIVTFIIYRSFANYIMYVQMIDSIGLGGGIGFLLYCNHRKFDTFFDHDIHVAICIAVGLAILIATYWVQGTKIGFWVFLVIMSIGWAAVPTFAVYYLHDYELEWYWLLLAFVPCLILNIVAHLISRRHRITKESVRDYLQV